MLMQEFKPAEYGPAVAGLLQPRRVAELGPGSPNVAAYESLKQLSNESLFDGRAIGDRTMASACLAALWLYHDYLDESHRLSQEIHTATGSYWHGIMHRREGDFGNAKYWFRQAGDHPVYPLMQRAAGQLTTEARPDPTNGAMTKSSQWDPNAFVDLCQKGLASGSQLESFCRWMALREWEILFDHCFRTATDPRPQ